MSKDSKPNTKNDPTAEDKARPVKALYFTVPTMLPGRGGASMALIAGPKGALGAPQVANATHCESIFFYRGDFVIDGIYWMPKTMGNLLFYQFA